MTFLSTAWAVLKRVPSWVWLILLALLPAVGAWYYRREAAKAKASLDVEKAKRKVERSIADAALTHAEQVRTADVSKVTREAEARVERAKAEVQIQGEEKKTEAAVETGGEPLAARVDEVAALASALLQRRRQVGHDVEGPR